MKKEDIIEELNKLDIKHDPAATNEVLLGLLPEGWKKSETVTVYCGKQPLNEGGVLYKKGEPIEVTPERAKALGEAVTDRKAG